MRRTPTIDHRELNASEGAGAVSTAFDRAFRALVDARTRYDQVHGDPDRIPELARASQRLEAARVEATALARRI